MLSAVESLDLRAWVERAPQGKRPFREAVHLVLTAIGTSIAGCTQPIVKGATLMAIRHDSTRCTRAADGATRERYSRSSELTSVQAFDDRGVVANEPWSCEVRCRSQTSSLLGRCAGSLCGIPDPPTAAVQIQVSLLDQATQMALQRVAAGARQFDGLSHRDSAVFTDEFHHLE